MITIRPSADRGHFNHGWLNTKHTFSFGRYIDRKHMGFRSLRVINEDIVAPGQGFGEHPHENMEIISYVLSGTLAHRDSLGHVQELTSGQIQRMSAGTGIEHAEFNPSASEPVHFLQIWLLPAKQGAAASYEQRTIDPNSRHNRLALIASGDAAADAVRIGQDVRLYSTVLDAGKGTGLDLSPNRHAWVQVVKGSIILNGQELQAGDGAAATSEKHLELQAKTASEVLVFDLI